MKPTPTQRRPARGTLVAVGMVAAAGAIAWFGWDANRADGSVARETVVLSAGQAPAMPVVFTTAPEDGTLPTRIVVSSAGIDARITEVGVVEQDGRRVWDTAWRAAGHHIDSARPGQPGNMVLTGHVSVADRQNIPVFAALDQVVIGDFVEVHSGDRVWRYQVERVLIAAPSDVRLLRSDHTATVTLITCTTDLENRLVVIGRLTEEAL